MGKHGFLILTEPDGELPDVARSYLQVIQPEPIYPSQQVFNFAWIFGRDDSNETVRELDGFLKVSSPDNGNRSGLTAGNNSSLINTGNNR